MRIEHTPTSAIPGEAVICYCNHTAHPARLTNATVINFLPTNENFELLLPSPLVGAHLQLEVFPAPLWEQSGPHKTQIQWDACPPRCRAHPKSASPQLLLLGAHLAASRSPAGANATWRGTCRPSAPRTMAGISAGAAPSRGESAAPGPQLSTVKQ